MAIWLLILLFLIYILFYTFASFLFSYKIFLVSNNKYKLGALVSGVALFINFSLYAFVPFLAVTIQIWWLVLVLILALSIGSFLSVTIVSKLDLFHKDKDEKKADKIKKLENDDLKGESL